MRVRFCRFSPCYSNGVQLKMEEKSSGVSCNTFPCLVTTNSTDIDTVYANSAKEPFSSANMTILPDYFKLLVCRVERMTIFENWQKSSRFKIPCVLPFKYNGKSYDSCTKEASPQWRNGEAETGSRQWCGLTDNLDLNEARIPDFKTSCFSVLKGESSKVTKRQWAVCRADQIGKWSSWKSNGCSKFCRLEQSRTCLVSPCHGESIKNDLPCETGDCEQPQWQEWSTWSCQCDGSRAL